MQSACCWVTPLQQSTRSNNLSLTIDLLCQNEDPNLCGRSTVSPILWAASNANLEMLAALLLFGAAPRWLMDYYPTLDTYFSKKDYKPMPDLRKIYSSCPIQFLLTIDKALLDKLLPHALRLKRCPIRPATIPSVHLRCYFSNAVPDIYPAKARQSLLALACCMQRKEVPVDVFRLLLPLIHAYAFTP